MQKRNWDQPKYTAAFVQEVTGVNKGQLQNWLSNKYITAASNTREAKPGQRIGTGNRRLFSARNMVSIELLKHIMPIVPPSVAAEWASTSFVSNLDWYAWLIHPGTRGVHTPMQFRAKTTRGMAGRRRR